MTHPYQSRPVIAMWLFGIISILLGTGCLLLGSVDIPAADVWHALFGGDTLPVWRTIVHETRIPMAITALIAGASLAVAGLMMQTTFDNPLAGPSILGVSSGSSLGVAVTMLLLGGGAAVGLATSVASIIGALAGATLVLTVLLALSRAVKSSVMLLIAGMMTGYLASSVIALLNFFASREGVHSYVVWGLGTFSATGNDRLWMFATPAIASLAVSALMIKPLNALLLGRRYAESLGVNVRAVRSRLLAISAVLTALVTAFCGPIGFIGLIVPHIARIATGTSNHSVLLPATALAGGATGLLTALLSVAPGAGIIPVNAITPVIGVPIIIYIIINRRKLHYFN